MMLVDGGGKCLIIGGGLVGDGGGEEVVGAVSRCEMEKFLLTLESRCLSAVGGGVLILRTLPNCYRKNVINQYKALGQLVYSLVNTILRIMAQLQML